MLQFGETEKIRLVRFLNSCVMVRVGGGWVTLEEFLEQNDPCRGKWHGVVCPWLNSPSLPSDPHPSLKLTRIQRFRENYCSFTFYIICKIACDIESTSINMHCIMQDRKVMTENNQCDIAIFYRACLYNVIYSFYSPIVDYLHDTVNVE